MGIEEEANRTLFIRNLDQRVTEELLFELFLQAGPLTKTKIPKDNDGKQKTFGFAVYKDEESVPYALKLLDGTSLFGRTIHVQPRNGSTVNSQTSSPANTPNPHGQWSQGQMNSPPYSPQMQRASGFGSSFGSPDSMQKQVMMSNLMLQIQMTQMQQQNGGSLLGPPPQQRQHFAGGGGGGGGGGGSYDGGSRNGGGGGHHDGDSSSWPQHSSSSQMNAGGHGGHHSRGQRYAADGGGGRHQQQHGRGGGYHYHDNKGGNNYHQGNRGSSRHHHDDRSDNRGYQDSRRRRY